MALGLEVVMSFPEIVVKFLNEINHGSLGWARISVNAHNSFRMIIKTELKATPH